MYDWPSRTPRKERGRSRPIRGSATLTTVESRKTIPDPSTAAARIQRERVILSERSTSPSRRLFCARSARARCLPPHPSRGERGTRVVRGAPAGPGRGGGREPVVGLGRGRGGEEGR